MGYSNHSNIISSVLRKLNLRFLTFRVRMLTITLPKSSAIYKLELLSCFWTVRYLRADNDCHQSSCRKTQLSYYNWDDYK